MIICVGICMLIITSLPWLLQEAAAWFAKRPRYAGTGTGHPELDHDAGWNQLSRGRICRECECCVHAAYIVSWISVSVDYTRASSLLTHKITHTNHKLLQHSEGLHSAHWLDLKNHHHHQPLPPACTKKTYPKHQVANICKQTWKCVAHHAECDLPASNKVSCHMRFKTFTHMQMFTSSKAELEPNRPRQLRLDLVSWDPNYLKMTQRMGTNWSNYHTPKIVTNRDTDTMCHDRSLLSWVNLMLRTSWHQIDVTDLPPQTPYAAVWMVSDGIRET